MSLKITQLTSLATPAAGDLLPIVDIDDITMAPSGTDHAITVSGLLGFLGFGLLATTGAAGHALVNGTGNFLTWTAPSDGNMHRVFPVIVIHVTTLETGGNVNIGWNAPDGAAVSSTPFFGGAAAGVYTSNNLIPVLIQAGSTFAISQNTALTAGAATVFAELWGG